MITQNTFTDGLIMDLNPLTTPNSVLTDALNATIITYNGEEFVLQNDQGNCKIERAKLSTGFIPVGMTEYGGIVYIVSLNPETGEDEVGCFPSPERDFTTSDFEDLTPSKFKTSDFIVNTGQTDLKESTSVLSKLVEPELLQLNPGDMFLVTFNIHVPATGNPAADRIETEAKMNQYISKDAEDRKLFKLKFYKITDDNNLNEINPNDIKLIKDGSDLENEYVFFKEKNQGTIAVGLELETLDTFDINVVDTSRKTDALKSAVIEAVGFSDSLAKFQGVKVDISEPNTESFFIDKTADVRKVSARLAELAPDSKLIGSVTPYSPYALYPKLKRDFNLELGKYASAGSGVNDIYRYFTGSNYVKVDFDFKLEGNSSNGLVLYVEFYDPWSDYSIVKVVDNPTYYGINSVVMETVVEPVTDIFNSTQVGGTNLSALSINTDTTYLKTILNKSNLVRNTATLRRNHFYIVRISGVDVDTTGSTPVYTHYDFYKALYTNEMFNPIYTLQNTVQIGSPQYVPDFMALDFNLSNIKFSVDAKETANINASPISLNTREDLMTNTRYYKISPIALPQTPGYKFLKRYRNSRNHNLGLTLTGTTDIFGTFKDNLLSVTIPTIENSTGTGPTAPKITDIDYDGDTDISPNSSASWSITQINDRNYSLLSDVTTERSVYSAVLNRTIQGVNYKELSMANQLYAPLSSIGWANNRAGLNYSKYLVECLTPSNQILAKSAGSGVDDDVFNEAIRDFILGARPGTSAIVGTSRERTWFYPNRDGYGDCARNDPNGTAWWKPCTMIVRRNDNLWHYTRTHDFDTMVDFWSSIKVASNVQQTMQTYFPSQTIKANAQINTRVEFPALDITTNFNPSAPGVKTYLSTIMQHAVSNTRVEFSTANINAYIASRVGASTIVDGKKTIRDGFIPYIDSPKQTVSKIKIADVSIIQSADNTVIAKMSAGESQISSDSSLTPGRFAHLQIFTDNPNYQQWIPYLELWGGNAGEVNPDTVSIAWRNTGGIWQGANSRVDRCDAGADAPDMIPSIMITRT